MVAENGLDQLGRRMISDKAKRLINTNIVPLSGMNLISVSSIIRAL